jgi:hypothetical protein
MTEEAKQIKAAVITDWRNHALQESIVAQSKMGDFKAAFSNLNLVAEPLHHNLLDHDGFQELLDIFNKGYQSVIISIGVPEMSQDYPHKIHRLLEAWKQARRKPVIMLTSSNPNKDSIIDLVNTWSGWDHMPDALVRAIRISKQDLTRSEALIPTLQDSLQIFQELKSELLKAPSEQKPSIVVRGPDIAVNSDVKSVDPVGV